MREGELHLRQATIWGWVITSQWGELVGKFSNTRDSRRSTAAARTGDASCKTAAPQTARAAGTIQHGALPSGAVSLQHGREEGQDGVGLGHTRCPVLCL